MGNLQHIIAASDFFRLDTMETIGRFFGGATGASALLSGFSFAAALQLIGSGRAGPAVRGAVILLYSATLLFLFGIVGFNNASVRPVSSDLTIFEPDHALFSQGRLTFTMDFYQAYAGEFLLVLVAGFCFITGAIISAWIYSATIGKSILAVVCLIMISWGIWFGLG